MGRTKTIAGFEIETDPEFYKDVFAIMLPVAAMQAINMGVNMFDTIMLGQFGEAQLSASSLANQYYSFYNIFCMGIIGGASVLAAQYWGAGEKEKVKETFNMALRLAFLVSALFTVITWFFPGQIMAIYTSEEAVIEQGVKYLRITTFVFIIHGTEFVMAQLMRSVENANLALIVSCVSFVVNLAANYVFIFGKFGAPRMEIAGAALGTLIARTVEFAITFIYIFCFDRRLGLRPKDLVRSPSKDLYRSYFRLGLPVLVSDGLLGLGNNMVSVVLGHMGSAVVSANAVCQVVDRLCTVVIQGISNAAGVVIGHSIGRGDLKGAQIRGNTLYLLGIVLGAAAAGLVLLIGPLTILFYTLEEETLEITYVMMRAYAFVVLFQCVQSVMTKGVLRGGGDTKFLMKADILFMWLISIPLGAVGGLVLGWPAWMTIICLRIDYIIKSVWCIRRLRSGKWIHSVKKAA